MNYWLYINFFLKKVFFSTHHNYFYWVAFHCYLVGCSASFLKAKTDHDIWKLKLEKVFSMLKMSWATELEHLRKQWDKTNTWHLILRKANNKKMKVKNKKKAEKTCLFLSFNYHIMLPEIVQILRRDNYDFQIGFNF